jgi:hypothetical protein
MDAGGHWTRQLQFVRASEADGASYLVLRDRMRGGEPTMWQFWTVSEAIVLTSESSKAKRIIAAAPGERITEASRLPQSNGYTAIGQFDVDIDFYIAEPRTTPRHTLRFGLTHNYGSVHGYTEYQDLLHLQRPGDGDYFVVIFPRDRGSQAPSFATLAEGKVVEVSGSFGRDLAFLSPVETVAEAGGARFEGTAGTVQARRGEIVLSLPAAGSLQYRGIELSTQTGAELRLAGGDALSISFPADLRSEARFRAPGDWRIADGQVGARLVPQPDSSLVLIAARGVRNVRLERR